MYVHIANIKLASRPFIGESELMDQERMKIVGGFLQHMLVLRVPFNAFMLLVGWQEAHLAC